MNKNCILLDDNTLLVSDIDGNMKKVINQNDILLKLMNENDIETIDKLIEKYNIDLNENKKMLCGLRYLSIVYVIFFSVAAILHPMMEGITLNSIVWSSMWILFLIGTITYCPFKRYRIKKEINMLKILIDKGYQIKEELLNQKINEINSQEKITDIDLIEGMIFKFEDPTKKYEDMIIHECISQVKRKKKVLKYTRN